MHISTQKESPAVFNSSNKRHYPLIKRGFVYLFLLLFIQLSAYAQHRMLHSKIDPVLQYALNYPKLRNNLPKAALSGRLKVEPTEGVRFKNAPVEKRYECIVYTKNPKALTDNGIVVNSVLPTFVTAWVTPEQLEQMSQMPQVTYIESPQTNHLHNDVAVGNSGASLLHQGKLNNTVYKGKNVLVGIYDTGIDWDHFDFRDPADTTKSRIVRIWDQTLTAGTGEAPPSGFTYGVEYTQNQINNELDGTPANVVRERDINGHGTHVAGTAAGNGSALASKKYTGMAPEADIVVIKGGNGSFSESRMIDGLTYFRNLATSLGKPAVLNWSIGGQFGAHDGSRPYELAIDAFTTSAPGRAVVVSAGNDNGLNTHKRVELPANGGLERVAFNVSDTTAADIFEFTMYANDSSDIAAAITPPDGIAVIAKAGEDIDFIVMDSSFTVFLFNGIDPGNNKRIVDLYVVRNTRYRTRPTGLWTITLVNNSANKLTMDGWLIYRNAAFNSNMVVGGNSDYLVSSPGNATSAITVASYTAKNNWYSNVVPGAFTYPFVRQDSISSFSSRGPRADGLQKPEIAAQGEVVISSLSSDAAATFSPALIIEPNKYVVEQGTSMAAPGVTGAVALLLQANAAATATQLKNYITTSANKDVMTELVAPTPNTSWGYGKLDVFKAASLLFGCAPAEHKIFKYDSSTINAQESGQTLTTQRVALRFSPDINGKLGGVFFHPSTTSTSLFLEVRTNSGGNPGTLLGTLNIDSSRIARYAFNYIDLSILNVSITSGTDYFIILARAPTSIANWSLRGETLAIDGRSYISLNGGSVWGAAGIDYKIRPLVYNNGQTTGYIASGNSVDARNLNTSTQFINSNCELIDQVIPSGINPVNGTVTSRVWIESSVPKAGGKPFVQRHYEINPPAGASTASARVTLYFKQSEFDAFNNDPTSTLNLPAGPTDATGKANLKIGKFTGTSADGTGLPESYSGTTTVIDPADGDIVWNAEVSRWEVTFDVTGFSGFIVQTSTSILPLLAEYFKGTSVDDGNMLNWKLNCNSRSAKFEVERSINGVDFNSIGSLVATENGCLQANSFKDDSPESGKDYYRIKMVENTGTVAYTEVILLENARLVTKLYPTVLASGSPVQVSFGGARGRLYITDALGRQILTRDLTKGVQSINLGRAPKGLYLYSIKDGQKVVSSGKIIVE